MNAVSLRRHVDASPDRVREHVRDVVPFMEAAGFDTVELDGDELRIENRVGILGIELTLELVNEEDATLVYEQRDGVFESMRTTYHVTPDDGGSEVVAETEFALDVAVVGDFLDTTVIERQRKKELSAQFDYLEALGDT